MIYLILFAILFILELIYIPLARRFGIGAPVTPRSSHASFTPVGGGFIFPVAAAAYVLWNHDGAGSPFTIIAIGTLVLGVVSFIDDIRDLSPLVRLVVQTFVVGYTFKMYLYPDAYDLYIILVVCGVGFINASNFMDGINGLLPAYSSVTLLTLAYCYMNPEAVGGPMPDAAEYLEFIWFIIIALAVLSLFNWRPRARVFAGDTGSITIGYIIIVLTSLLILATRNASMIVFLMVYAVDTSFTIVQRLFAGENIFLPHRLHLYQILANQWRIPHYMVAMGYAVVQLAINVAYFFVPCEQRWTYVILVVAVLVSVYFTIKRSPRSRRRYRQQ